MDLFLGADHQGFALKNQLAGWLRAEGHTVTDLGAKTLEIGDDYPAYAFAVGEAVAQDTKNRRGILLCGSGVGVAVAANKVSGIRAALIHDSRIAREARHDDDVNVLALAAAHISASEAQEIIHAFLMTSFAGDERYQRRLDQISTYEHTH